VAEYIFLRSIFERYSFIAIKVAIQSDYIKNPPWLVWHLIFFLVKLANIWVMNIFIFYIG